MSRHVVRACLLALGVAAAVTGCSSTAAPPPAMQRVSAVRTVHQPPRIEDLATPGRLPVGRSFVIGGLGSSVGAGATLTDPNETPVAHFAADLRRKIDPAGLARWTVLNASNPGSTVSDGLARDWAGLQKSHPDVVVLAYGMNDGEPFQFNSGETYGGTIQAMTSLIAAIRASGAIPVLLTTPSPHTTRSNWNYLPNPSIPQQASVDTSVPVRDVVLPGGQRVPESTRHAAVNAGFRAIAASEKVDLIDVEPYWLRAVAEVGQDALFDPNQVVHPNLLGHRLSYQAAEDAWFTGPLGSPVALRPAVSLR